MKLSRLTNRQLRNLLRRGEVRFGPYKPYDLKRYKMLFRERDYCQELIRWSEAIASSFLKAQDVIPEYDVVENWKYDVKQNCGLGDEAIKPVADLYAQWRKAYVMASWLPDKIKAVMGKHIRYCNSEIEQLERTWPEFKTEKFQRKFH